MKYFGTDGIRQKAEKFTPEFLTLIVKGLVDYAGDNIKVLIGGDTRESSEWILADLEAALETFGIEYGNVGVLPTPAINYCFPEMGFDFAIDVTASHNPYTDNGIKILERGQRGGIKLSPKGQEAVETALASGKTYELTAASLREDLHDEAIDIYKAHLVEYVGEADLSGLSVGLDCANGATSALGDTMFRQLGATVELIHADTSYGTKINNDCGSTHIDSLRELVKAKGLDCGIAFDGDGDRVLMIDHTGAVVDGDQIIAMLADYLQLDSIAVTVMAGQGILNWAKERGLTLEITPVGDTNVAAAMREKNIAIGGEQSGHVILPGEATGDGMLAALLVCKIMATAHKTLAELAGIIAKYPQVSIALDATSAQKSNLATSSAVKDILAQYEEKVKSISGRLLVRPSGTEDLIRITVWGDDEDAVKSLAEELTDKLGEVL